MNKLQKKRANQLYILLAGLFVAALVTCNLIANKFIAIQILGKTFTISAGVLPYPITFLITDILSEIYGRKKTNNVVFVGFAASVFVLGILYLGSLFPAIESSPVSDSVYQSTFANSWRVVGASMLAYLSAQLIDVRLFHFWKNLTKGKMLWVRNNLSTVFSQAVDTSLVVLVLFWGVKSNSEMLNFIKDGWMFKAMAALIDTPIFYLLVLGLRKYFRLKPGQELNY